MKQRIPMETAGANDIQKIQAHLQAGHQIAILTHTSCTVLDHRHLSYIRPAKGGYRLGWPGKKSSFTFAYAVKYVPKDMRL